MKEPIIFNFEFNPRNILFLVNKKEDTYQVYKNGKYIETGYLYTYNSRNIEEAVKRHIFFECGGQHKSLRNFYNTKILGYGHEFEDEEDFTAETWTLAWELAAWIQVDFWTILTTPHASGLWTKFLLPKTIIDRPDLKITRWLNYYWTKERKGG